MRHKKIAALIMAAVALFVLSACGASGNQGGEKKDITVACVETTYPLVEKAATILAKKGYNVTYQIFDNNVNAFVAGNDGSIDSVFASHKPFMESFNAANNGDFVMIEPYVFWVGMGLYSDKHESISDIPDGGTIAIPNDPMNMNRALRILEGAGLIDLDESVEWVSLVDITGNPKNLNIIDVDQTQTVRSLEDTDAAVAFFSHIKNAGKDFNTYLAKEVDPKLYPISIVVKEEYGEAQWAIDLNAAFLEEDVKAFAFEHYGGLWQYLD